MANYVLTGQTPAATYNQLVQYNSSEKTIVDGLNDAITRVNVTASNAISASWPPLGAGGGTTLYTGSTYPITSSEAIHATNADNSFIEASTTNLNYNFVFVPNVNSGFQPMIVDGGGLAYYNPNIDLLTIPNISASTITASVFTGASFTGSVFTGSVTGSLNGTASNAISASWAPGGGGGTTLITASTYQITASWALSTLTSSTVQTASYLSPYQPYTLLSTSSTNWITCSFLDGNEAVYLNLPASYSFTQSNITQNGYVSDLFLHISSSAIGTCSLSFPNNWTNLGGTWPTSITSSKMAILWIRSMDTNMIMGTYNVQF